MQTVAERLTYCRELAGISMGELARLSGVTRQIISVIEGGGRHFTAATTLSPLVRALGASLDWLVDGIGEAPDREAVAAAVEAARQKSADPQEPPQLDHPDLPTGT